MSFHALKFSYSQWNKKCLLGFEIFSLWSVFPFLLSSVWVKFHCIWILTKSECNILNKYTKGIPVVNFDFTIPAIVYILPKQDPLYCVSFIFFFSKQTPLYYVSFTCLSEIVMLFTTNVFNQQSSNALPSMRTLS